MSLQLARTHLAILSVRKAALRLEKEKNLQEHANIQGFEEQLDVRIAEAISFKQAATQYGDSSSVTKGSFSANGQLFATVGSSGEGKIFNTLDPFGQQFCSEITNFKASSKLCDVKFHPRCGIIPEHAPNLLTGSANGELHFWTYSKNLPQQQSVRLAPHSDRINKVHFTSDGIFFFAASYDKTWSFWDCRSLKQIQSQSGHEREIHAAAIHPDESLYFTGDLGGAGMVWDLRTGKGIYEIDQSDSILCCDFKQNGFQLAIAGKSNIISIFDLRRKKQLRKIPAHNKLISDLKYQEDGLFLASVSHDNSVKLWQGSTYTQINREDINLPSKITSLDVCQGLLTTTGIDRKWTMFVGRKQNQVKLEAQ